MTTWYTAEDQELVLEDWPDAPIENTRILGFLLGISKRQVLTYAPKLVPELTVVDGVIQSAIVIPDDWYYAQLQHAKALWDAGRVSSEGNVGEGGFVYTPRPLDATIRAIIRPKDIRPDAY